jgi:hypothetical protein
MTRELEKRQRPRRGLKAPVTLIDNLMDGSEEPVAIPGDAINISDGGLYASVPLGYGVAIGNRYTFQIQVAERGPDPGSQCKVTQQGRVLRAELMIGEDGHADRVGIAVELFGHRDGVLPTPMTA